MFPAGDVGGSIGAFTVADGEVDDLSVQLCCAEDQVKIAEGIEIAKVGTVGGDLFVIFTPTVPTLAISIPSAILT